MGTGTDVIETAITIGAAISVPTPATYTAAALKVAGLVEDFVSDWNEERVERWWKGVVLSPDWETPEEVQGLVEEKLRHSKKAKEVIYASAKELLDAISTEAAEVIGSITAEYLRGDKGPDAFFRGATRVFADLSASDLEFFREVVRFVTQTPERHQMIVLKPEGNLVQQDGATVKRTSSFSGSVPDLKRLFRLLKSNDLAEEGAGGVWDSMSGPDVIMFNRDVAVRLARYLGVKVL